MNLAPTRRRALAIVAAAGADFGAAASSGSASAQPVHWRGQVMGALASMEIHHPDRLLAARLIQQSIAEIARLERIFSLYRSDSAVATLNREGALMAPPGELVELLAHCQHCWRMSDGAFDPTVQSLWQLYRQHFEAAPKDIAGPPPGKLRAALDKVDFRQVAFDRNRVVLLRRGMALTLNGIAQGYVTDRVVDLLRANGLEHCLVNLGEVRTLGPKANGAAWRVGIADPSKPENSIDHFDLVDKAIATSGAYGFRFDSAGRFHHLFDARTGSCADRYRCLSVIASTATVADGLSTAFSLLELHQIEQRCRMLVDVEVRIVLSSGEQLRLFAP